MIVVVFDFDDTLFPTTHNVKNPNDVHTELAELILDLISMLDVHSPKFYIITNAGKDWVRGCLSTCLPGCENICAKMELISTVDDGFSSDPDVKLWKSIAFNEKLSVHFEDGEKHELICFGDAEHDRTAAMYMKEKFPNILVKNFKMVPEPPPEFLVEQYRAIKKVVDNVIYHQDHVDIMINAEYYETEE